MKSLIVIDGNSILNRAFFALPPLITKDGVQTNAVYGFLNMMFSIIDLKKPNYVVIAFDVSGGNFRHDMYSEYKGTRKGMDPDLKSQIPVLKEILDTFGISRVELKGFEADDLIGTISTNTPDDVETIIVSGDKDMLQLVTDTTKVLITKKGTSDLKEYLRNDVKEDIGVYPEQIIDYKAIRGDSSDNIPGVKGIGQKGATKLLEKYNNLLEIYDDIENVETKRNQKLLIESKEMAFLSRDLAKINTDAPIDVNIDEYKYKLELDNVINILEKYELNNIIKYVSNKSRVKDELSTKYLTELKNIDFNKTLYIDFFDYKEKTIYVLKQKKIVITDDLSLLNGKKIRLKGFSTFELIHNLTTNYDVEIEITDDLQIMHYLLNPDSDSSKLEKYTNKFQLNTFKDITANFKLEYFDVKEKIIELLIKRIQIIEILSNDYREKIIENGLLDLYSNVELALILILVEMKKNGFKVDIDYLDVLDKKVSNKLKIVEDSVYAITGKFNINSPKQLGKVLFEDLDLPVIKKTKTGYSTNKETLFKLKGRHEVIDFIAEYRMLSKLKSTYIDGIRKVISDDLKIHSSLNQTVVATGRLSSTDPNLQNIPIRLKEGREVRKIFTASSKNHILISADYSQIELRVLAHISNDKNMIEAYSLDKDIHKITASKIFGVNLDEVTSEMRSRAKAVNFGLVYGMSDYGLSEDLDIPVFEAKDYIEKYFEKYPDIKKYMEDVVEECKEKGYVTTLLGRKRYLPNINSKNYHIRNFANRAAMNTPIQGTAADIIKIAMINVYNEIKKRKLKSKLILQIHDELIIDALKSEECEVKELLIEQMQNAYEMKVPLIVNVSTGDSWYDAK